MKKTILIIGSLLLITSLHAGAQGKRSLRNQNTAVNPQDNEVAEPAHPMSPSGIPKVLIGTIETATSSREKILGYPRLLPMELGCEVKGFTFTISAGDKTWTSGPVKGAVFTEEIKDKIKETDAPQMKITIDNIHLLYNGKDVVADPVTVAYNH